MANVLNTDNKIAVIAALAEGSSIRSIERITGIHRDTIMRLGVKVGKGCTNLMDRKMQNLPCQRLELDEIWGFVGKKAKTITEGDEENGVGDVWTWCAIDAETKLVPSFMVGIAPKPPQMPLCRMLPSGWLIVSRSAQTGSMPTRRRSTDHSGAMWTTARSSKSTEPRSSENVATARLEFFPLRSL